MNAMSSYPGLNDNSRLPPSPAFRFGLDRAALANGAALRIARVQDIEADMDLACEHAAMGQDTSHGSTDCDAWDEQAWNRYVVEAIRQVHLCGRELEVLRREARQLDRLLRAA